MTTGKCLAGVNQRNTLARGGMTTRDNRPNKPSRCAISSIPESARETGVSVQPAVSPHETKILHINLVYTGLRY